MQLSIHSWWAQGEIRRRRKRVACHRSSGAGEEQRARATWLLRRSRSIYSGLSFSLSPPLGRGLRTKYIEREEEKEENIFATHSLTHSLTRGLVIQVEKSFMDLIRGSHQPHPSSQSIWKAHPVEGGSRRRRKLARWIYNRVLSTGQKLLVF